MPKSRIQFVCNHCGGEFPQYFGKCPACRQWNTLVEQRLPTLSTSSARSNHLASQSGPAQPVGAIALTRVTEYPQSRLSSGYGEFDRVLGGGIVPGSLVLVGGHPGIGKSTLLLQVADQLAGRFPILYVCAEESAQQVKLRWQRLRSHGTKKGKPTEAPQLYLLPETSLDPILLELESLKPQVAIIDSIQALYLPTLSSAPGSVSQVRECTTALMQVAKRSDMTLLIVGHVTKEGEIAGPKVLEHLVDTVLYFEGDRFARHRLLRSVKNRFGPTHEIGVFTMEAAGLVEVPNPSALFLGNRGDVVSGTATIVACEGTRPLVVEIQALVSPTSYPSPRRSTTGLEYNRLLQILAVLEKRVGIPLSKLDAYVAASGGLTVAEPAADLGVAIAVVASFRDRVVDSRTVLVGEVGLGGQLRSVTQMELRLKEAAKLGFQRAIVPRDQTLNLNALEVIPVARVVDAMGVALANVQGAS